MFSKAALAAAACVGLLVPAVTGHMVITSPVPYGQGTLNNSPLQEDGSDFPCKQRPGVYKVDEMNNVPVGVPQKLAFKGGATHGGGSCQLSVTLDKQPTKSSKWKVVHSILGGCPNGVSGNANGSPNYAQNPTFEWTMPKGMPNGQYTLAWTWFNKVGNREMYMNCAPITVTGGADNHDVLDTLPDMFVANIPTTECETVEGEDLVFPHPGLYVQTAGSALGTKLIGPCTAGGAGKEAGNGNGSGSAPPYGGGSRPASAPAASPTGYQPGARPGGPGPDAPSATGYGEAPGSKSSPNAPSVTGYGGAPGSQSSPDASSVTGYGEAPGSKSSPDALSATGYGGAPGSQFSPDASSVTGYGEASGSQSSPNAPSVAGYGGAPGSKSSPDASSVTGYGEASGSQSSPNAPSVTGYGGAPGSQSSPSETIVTPQLPSNPVPRPQGYNSTGTPEADSEYGTAATIDPVTATTMATVTRSGPAPLGYAAPTGYGGKIPQGEASSSTRGTASTAEHSNGTKPSNCSGGSVSCDSPGNMVCIGSNQWGLCDSNNCAVPRPLTSGVKCSGGTMSKRGAHLAHIKRRLGHHSRRSLV